jgi:hypothetical protein
VEEAQMTLSNNSAEFMNQLAEDFTREPDLETSLPVPIPPDAAEQTLAPKIREEFAEIDSYPLETRRSLQPVNQAPFLSARQAPYFMD